MNSLLVFAQNTQVMNLSNKITAKFYISVLLLIMVTVLANKANAQKQYTTILKNFNPEAQNLYHELSPQGDTLYLQAESIFYKVTFLNSLDKKVYRFNPPLLEAKISLHDIIVGDYTVLVYKKDRIIVFHIKRLLEIEVPDAMAPEAEIYANNNMNFDGVATIGVPTENIQLAENVDVLSESIQLASNETVSAETSEFKVELRGYNLSSMNRSGMQTREDYRRNNLRPNGKPYN